MAYRGNLNTSSGSRMFKIMFGCIAGVVAVVFISIFTFWGFVGYKVATTPTEEIAAGVGGVIGQLKHGFEKGYNDAK